MTAGTSAVVRLLLVYCVFIVSVASRRPAADCRCTEPQLADSVVELPQQQPGVAESIAKNAEPKSAKPQLQDVSKLAPIADDSDTSLSAYAEQEEGRTERKNEEHASWWTNLNHPQSFKMVRLKLMYPEAYFSATHTGHPLDIVPHIVKQMRKLHRDLSGRPLTSIVEFGAAHGFFTKMFARAELDYQAVEGSPGGIAGLLQQKGVARERVHLADLRLPLTLPPPRVPRNATTPKYDLAMCTEVGEHIEISFHSQLVRTLTQHADLIYFSFCPPRTCPKGVRPSKQCRPETQVMLQHPSEMPLRYWVNLFDFFGYGTVLMQDPEHPDSNEGFAPRLCAFNRGAGVLQSSFLKFAKRVQLRGAQADSLVL